jgi:hypothetical protein
MHLKKQIKKCFSCVVVSPPELGLRSALSADGGPSGGW